MNALDRADQTLARAQARRAGVVTPDSATSPMDQTNTVQLPRIPMDPRSADPDSTMIIAVDVPDHRAPAPFGPARPRR